MRLSEELDARPGAGSRTGATVVLAAVLGLQLWFLYHSVAAGATPVFPSLAATYVVAGVLVGYATDRHRSPGFLVVLFAGWTVLMVGVYLETPAVGYGAVAALTAAGAAYYAYEYRTAGDSGVGGVGGDTPSSGS